MKGKKVSTMSQIKKMRFLLIWGFIAPFLLGVSSVHATVVVIEPLEVMSLKSEVVIHGVVFDQEVRHDDRGRIITLTTVEVLDGLKGATKGEQVVIYQVGGTFQGISQWIAGNHRFAQGEEFILFGVRHKDMVVSYGVGIGKFRVIRDASGTVVVEDVNNVIGAYGQRNGQMKLEHAIPRVYLTLDTFKDLVRDVSNMPPPLEVRKPKLRVLPTAIPQPLKTPRTPMQPRQPKQMN